MISLAFNRDVTTGAVLATEHPSGEVTALQMVLGVVVRTAPAGQHVAVSLLDKHGPPGVLAASSDVARRFDSMQFRLREGPAFEAAMRQGDNVVLTDRDAWARWPEFTPRARALGLTASASVGLSWEDRPIGSISLYSLTAQGIRRDTVSRAMSLADQAAATLAFARKAEQLEIGMLSRQRIGQAIGILMERYGLDEPSAFNVLRRVSQNGNRKLRDVAAELVEEGALEELSQSPTP